MSKEFNTPQFQEQIASRVGDQQMLTRNFGIKVFIKHTFKYFENIYGYRFKINKKCK